MDWPTPSNDDVPTFLLASLSRTFVDAEEFILFVVELYEAGVTPDYRGFFAGEERCRIAPPGLSISKETIFV